MTTVSDLLKDKGDEVWSIGPDKTVYDAIKLMDMKGIGALVVISGDKLVGIISERDYARKVILKDRASKNTSVQEIMTREVFYTIPEQKVEECMVMMTSHHIRHLPVMKDKKVTAMITLGDVVKEIIKEQNDKIKYLEDYVTWSESY